MIVTLTIHPLFEGGGTGEEISSTTVQVDLSNIAAADALMLGDPIIDAVKGAYENDPELRAFELRMTVEIEPEEVDDPKRPYIIEENSTYRIVASSAEEAEAIWLDKGTDAAEFIGVEDRDVYPA